MDKLTKLQEVNCRGNQFTSIPEDLLTCSHLQHLDFSGNRLREVPAGIGQLANLTSLVLKQNAFTEIPDQLLELSAYGGRCRIDFSGNGLPQAAAIQWKERGKVPEMNLVCAELASARQAKKMTLAEKVENWYEVAGKRQPDNISVLFKNQKACGALNKYLERALTINNATSPISNEATANTITAIIDEMINDPVVMERCTAIAIEAVATCDDRVLLALNDMYVETKVAKVGKTGSAQDMIKLMRSMIRMQILNGIAEQKYQRIIIETNRRIARARAGGYSITYHRPDFTEVRLALQILTRNSLQLPTPPGQTMKYMKVAQLSSQEVDNATTQVLSEMEDYPDVQLAENLAGWEAFRNNIYKDYAGYVEEINEKYLNLLVKVENDINTDKVSTLKSGEKITSAGYAAFCDRIKKQNNEEVDELYRALALELVQNTPRKTYTQQQYLDNDGPNLQNTTEV